MALATVLDVRNIISLTEDDISDEQIASLISYAQLQLAQELYVYHEDEEVSYIDEEKDNEIDGCFKGTAWINTDSGPYPIRDIVNKRLPVKVWTYNFEKNRVELAPITAWFKHVRKEDKFIKITVFADTPVSNRHTFECTPNHLIWTNKGYIRADSIKKGDTVFTKGYMLTPIQRQMIIGTMLGDGCIDKGNKNPALVVSHSIKQEALINLKTKILGNLMLSRRVSKQRKGSYSDTPIIIIRSKYDPVFKEFLDKFYDSNNNYKLSEDILDELGPISLAFWYMDDGSKQVRNSKPKKFTTTKGSTPIVQLSTHAFSQEDVKLLIQKLKKLGLTAYCVKTKKNQYFITLNANSSRIFYSMIAPYVVPELAYKLPDKYQNDAGYMWDELIIRPAVIQLKPAKVIDVQTIIRKKNQVGYCRPAVVYDLETPNHNYFVSGVLVHNSNKVYYTRFWPIADRNQDGVVDSNDVKVYKFDSEGNRTEATISSIDAARGKITLSEAPTSDYTLKITYSSYPPNITSSDLKMACIYLTAALCYAKCDPTILKHLDTLDVLRMPDPYNRFMKMYKDTLTRIKSGMAMKGEDSETVAFEDIRSELPRRSI